MISLYHTYICEHIITLKYSILFNGKIPQQLILKSAIRKPTI